MVKIQTPLKNGTAAVDPTLFSPDIIALNDEKVYRDPAKEWALGCVIPASWPQGRVSRSPGTTL